MFDSLALYTGEGLGLGVNRVGHTGQQGLGVNEFATALKFPHSHPA